MKVLHYTNQRYQCGLSYEHLVLVEAGGHKFKAEVIHDDEDFLGKIIMYVFDKTRLQFNPLWEEMIYLDYKTEEGVSMDKEWELLREPVIQAVEAVVEHAVALLE